MKKSQKNVIFDHFFFYNNRTRSKMKILASVVLEDASGIPKLPSFLLQLKNSLRRQSLNNQKWDFSGEQKIEIYLLTFTIKLICLNFNSEEFLRLQDFNTLGKLLELMSSQFRDQYNRHKNPLYSRLTYISIKYFIFHSKISSVIIQQQQSLIVLNLFQNFRLFKHMHVYLGYIFEKIKLYIYQINR